MQFGVLSQAPKRGGHSQEDLMFPSLQASSTIYYLEANTIWGFPGGSDSKESACNARDLGLIFPGLGRSPGEGNGYPLQYSCLEHPMDRGAW